MKPKTNDAGHDAHKWCQHYDWVSQYFGDEDGARDYADAMLEAAENQSQQPEKSEADIEREMKLLSQIETLIVIARGAIVIAIVCSPPFWVPRVVEVDWMYPVLTVATWALAAVVGKSKFWKTQLATLKQIRVERFFAWRSAHLRFPISHITPAYLYDGSTAPGEAGDDMPTNRPN